MRLLPERRHPDGKDLPHRNPRATDEQIQQALSGVLCRCFGDVRMLRAIRRYAREDGVTRRLPSRPTHAPARSRRVPGRGPGGGVAAIPQGLRRARRQLLLGDRC